MMANQAERIRILTDLARELQRCGPIYLAALLVGEAYHHACLESAVFGSGSRDDAALAVNARLRALAPARPAALSAPPRRPRRGSKRAALEAALAQEGISL